MRILSSKELTTSQLVKILKLRRAGQTFKQISVELDADYFVVIMGYRKAIKLEKEFEEWKKAVK